MDITINQALKDSFFQSMGITKEQAINTTISPQFCQNYINEDISLCFSLSKYDGFSILTYSQLDNEKCTIHLVLRIKNELVLPPINPLIILQQIINKYGLSFRIGNQFDKFIFKEILPISSNKIDLIEVFNPNNHDFIQMFFIKLDYDKVNCSLAFCLDADDYLSALYLNSTNEVVSIAPSLRKVITRRDVISSYGTFSGVIDKEQLRYGMIGNFFNVNYYDYYLETGIGKDCFYIIRNNSELKYHFYWDVESKGKIDFFIMWEPKRISITLLDSSDNNLKGDEDYINTHTKYLNTQTVFPPNSLITWLHEQDIIPNTIFSSMDDFYNETLLALQSIDDKVRCVNMISAFWDYQYENSKITSRKPKNEPDVQDIVQGLLSDIALLKNIEIIPQYPISGGLLDFLILGDVEGEGRKCICVEFKHAHSKNLVHGLVKQLPDYMKAKGAEYGIYCIFNFKGLYFDKPQKYTDETSLLIDLDIEREKAGLTNIRSIVIDLSFKSPPSKV